MDEEEVVASIPNFRLGNCEVCDCNNAKYTCPECEVKTCSLPCVKIHKKELNCSGIRNKIKFKPLQKFTNLDFQSDYFLLESAIRATNNCKRNGRALRSSYFHSHAKMRTKSAAYKRNINLVFLPKTFSRHKNNTTYYDSKKDKLFWKVEWVFPSVGASVVDERVPETEPLMTSLKKYLDPDQCENENLKKMLSDFQNTNKEIFIILKSERFSHKKFYLVDKNEILMENLSNKTIIEHPIFYVIHGESLSDYQIDKTAIPKEEKYSTNYRGTNLLFGSEDIEDDTQIE